MSKKLHMNLLHVSIALHWFRAILGGSKFLFLIPKQRQPQMNKFLTMLMLATGATSVTALAQPSAPQSPLNPIYACAEKTDPTERLACFDTAVAAVKAAEARSEIVALDQPRVAAVRREAFGFRIPSLPKFSLPRPASGAASSRQSEEETEEQVFAVARVGNAGGRLVLYLENGNVWQLNEAGDFNAPSRPPYNVRIRAAALGSYILSVEGRNKGYRVRRIE
jgi:hypothetical protein